MTSVTIQLRHDAFGHRLRATLSSEKMKNIPSRRAVLYYHHSFVSTVVAFDLHLAELRIPEASPIIGRKLSEASTSRRGNLKIHRQSRNGGNRAFDVPDIDGPFDN